MQDNSSNNKRLAKNTMFLYVRMIFVIFVAFYTTRIILNALGVVNYGIYNVVAGFVSLFAVLNNCLTTGTNRFYNYAIGKNDQEEISLVYNASLRIQFIILAILLIAIEVFGLWYIQNKMVIPTERLFAAQIIFQCSMLSLVFLVLQIPYSAAVMAHERMDFYALVSIIDAVGKLGIALLVMTITFDKLIVYGILLILISFLDFMLYFIYCRRNFPALKISRHLDKGIFKSLLSFSGWSILDPFSYIVRDQGSNMTLNLFFGPVVNAAYGIAAQVSGAVAGFASNLSIAFRPQIIQSYSNGDYVRTKRLMLSMSKINFTLQMLFAIPLIFELQYILGLWLGNGYPEFTAIFSALVLLINSINTLNEPISIIMVATGRIKKIKSVSMVIICSVVPFGYLLFYLGYPPYSIYLTMLVLTIVNQISCVYIMSKEFKELTAIVYLKIVAIPCFCFAVLSLIIPFVIIKMMDSSFIRLIMMFGASSISTLTLSYYVCLDKTEKTMLVNILSNILIKLNVKKH